MTMEQNGKRSGIGSMFRYLIKFLSPRPVQPGGHPTIPFGQIIAKPRCDGGYDLFEYYGIQIGWCRAGEVPRGVNVQTAMQNLARPVEIFVPAKGIK